VAKLDFPLSFGDLEVGLVDATLTAKLRKTNDTWRLEDGRLVGRWPTTGLLTSFDTLRDPFSKTGGGVCGDSVLYRDLKGEICAAADLATRPADDNKDVACDAVGITVFFTGETAQFGEAADREASVHRCGDTWTDSCPK
jgi:hypothetical protein